MRVQQQHQILGIAVTAIGAVGGIAIERGSLDLLLLIPLIAGALGLMHMDHAQAIRQLGMYISSTPGLGGWERSSEREVLHKGTARALVAVLPLAVLFVGAPVLAAIYEAQSDDFDSLLGEWALLILGGLLVVAYAIVGICFISGRPGQQAGVQRRA